MPTELYEDLYKIRNSIFKKRIFNYQGLTSSVLNVTTSEKKNWFLLIDIQEAFDAHNFGYQGLFQQVFERLTFFTFRLNL